MVKKFPKIKAKLYPKHFEITPVTRYSFLVSGFNEPQATSNPQPVTVSISS
jgi:hypothetical protein